MTQYESDISAHLSMVAAEVEAKAWHVENPVRRNNFLTRRLAALAIEDTDPFTDEDLDQIAA